MKVVLSARFGKFWISDDVVEKMYEQSPELFTDVGRPVLKKDMNSLAVRTHPALVADAIEYEGNESYLRVVEIPDDIDVSKLRIIEYDGIESVYEEGHLWGFHTGELMGGGA